MLRAIRRVIAEAYSNDEGTRAVESWQQRLATRYMLELLRYVDWLEDEIDRRQLELEKMKNGS